MRKQLLNPLNTTTIPHDLQGSFHPESLKLAARDIAAEAAALIVQTRREITGAADGETLARPMPVADTKSSAVDPVTIADTRAEAFIRERLRERYPGIQVLGEEEGMDDAPSGTAGGASDSITWVVDPIDGTVNFVYGIPAFAVSIAAVLGERPVAGAVVDVAHDRVYSAAVGGDATVAAIEYGPGGQPSIGGELALSCNSDVVGLGESLVATGFSYRAERRRVQAAILGEMLPAVRDIRRIGSAALDLCLLASGQVDAYYEHGLNSWDYAAGALIAARAGATVHLPDFRLTSEVGYPVVAAGMGVCEELLNALVRAGAGGNIDD